MQRQKRRHRGEIGDDRLCARMQQRCRSSAPYSSDSVFIVVCRSTPIIQYEASRQRLRVKLPSELTTAIWPGATSDAPPSLLHLERPAVRHEK